MVDITKEIQIESDWVNVSSDATLALADGTDYLFDIAAATGTLFWAETDSVDAPGADIRGHPWFPGTSGSGVDTRTFTKRSTAYLWLSCAGKATIAITPDG